MASGGERQPEGSYSESPSSDAGTPRSSCTVAAVACSHSPPGWWSGEGLLLDDASSDDPINASKISPLSDAASRGSLYSLPAHRTERVLDAPLVLPRSYDTSHTTRRSSSPPQRSGESHAAVQPTFGLSILLLRHLAPLAEQPAHQLLNEFSSNDFHPSQHSRSKSLSPPRRVLCSIDGVFLHIQLQQLESGRDLSRSPHP